VLGCGVSGGSGPVLGVGCSAGWGKRELGIDLPEYLGLMVRCLVEWSRGNVGNCDPVFWVWLVVGVTWVVCGIVE